MRSVFLTKSELNIRRSSCSNIYKGGVRPNNEKGIKIDMERWSEFTQTRYGAFVKKFFLKLHSEIKKVNEDPNKPNAVLFLNTKKGYWLYKVFEREEAVQPIDVYSDRYLKKMPDSLFLSNKLIYLVDDTLSHGYSLLETYELLAEHVEEKYICPLVFALHETVDLQEQIREAEGRKAAFWKSLRYFIIMPEVDAGEFCVQETNLLHNEGIPYAIDIPYLKDEKNKDLRTKFEVILTQDQFQTLRQENDMWKFHYNTYNVRNVKFLNGFIIQMKDEQLLSAVQDCFMDLVIEGTYVTDDVGNMHLVFVPFAISKSIDKERLKKLWNLLIDSEDYKAEIKQAEEPDNQNKSLLFRRYRECVYVVSMVIAERFKKYFEILTGIRLTYDYGILREHFSNGFIEAARSVEKRMTSDADYVYRKLIQAKTDTLAAKDFEDERKGKEEYNENKAYEMIAGEVVNRRISFLADAPKEGISSKGASACLGLDKMDELLNERFYFKKPEDKRYACTKITAIFQQSSICNNQLFISPDGSTVEKKFRYGENSDLALPFFNLEFYWAIILMAEKTGREKLLDKYYDFVDSLKEKFQEWGLYGTELTPEKFQENCKYYNSVLRNNFQLNNKAFYLKPFLRGELSGTETALMNKVEDFVIKTRY